MVSSFPQYNLKRKYITSHFSLILSGNKTETFKHVGMFTSNELVVVVKGRSGLNDV